MNVTRTRNKENEEREGWRLKLNFVKSYSKHLNEEYTGYLSVMSEQRKFDGGFFLDMCRGFATICRAIAEQERGTREYETLLSVSERSLVDLVCEYVKTDEYMKSDESRMELRMRHRGFFIYAADCFKYGNTKDGFLKLAGMISVLGIETSSIKIGVPENTKVESVKSESVKSRETTGWERAI